MCTFPTHVIFEGKALCTVSEASAPCKTASHTAPSSTRISCNPEKKLVCFFSYPNCGRHWDHCCRTADFCYKRRDTYPTSGLHWRSILICLQWPWLWPASCSPTTVFVTRMRNVSTRYCCRRPMHPSTLAALASPMKVASFGRLVLAHRYTTGVDLVVLPEKIKTL